MGVSLLPDSSAETLLRRLAVNHVAAVIMIFEKDRLVIRLSTASPFFSNSHGIPTVEN
jgi:hypothetical protein